MRRPKRLQFCALLFILCTVFSCQKRETLYALSQKDNNVTQQFFSLPTNAPPNALGIANALQQITVHPVFKCMNYPFVRFRLPSKE
jgi:hypothetical protein